VILSRYLSFLFLKLAIGTTLVLTAVAEILDLVDTIDDLLDRPEGAWSILTYVWLRLPLILDNTIPLGVLVGAVTALLLMARNSEITALRAAGVKMAQIFAMMLPAALICAASHLVISNEIVPKSQDRLASWWRSGSVENEKTVWLRVGTSVISFDQMSNNGRRLTGVRIYQRSEDGVIIGRILADTAIYSHHKWTLSGAVKTDWTRQHLDRTTNADGPWQTELTPQDVVTALTPNGRVSVATARAVISDERVPNAPLTFYETLVQRFYAAPLASVIMLLLAMPCAFNNWRSANSGRDALVALASGLLFLVIDGLCTTLGQTGFLNPIVGSWAALAIFAAYGTLTLRRLERGG